MQRVETLLPVDGMGESECVRRADSAVRRSLSAGSEEDAVVLRISRESFARSSPTSVVVVADDFQDDAILAEEAQDTTIIATKEHPVSLVNRWASFLQLEQVLLYWQRDNVRLFVGIAGWYTFGFVAVITTKLLLTTWAVPPLLLTVQQLLISSTVLNLLLQTRGEQGLQPWPADKHIQLDFVLIGLFNALDFLASNCGFEGADASFVETIKASEPITTTLVALSWKIDTLGNAEAASLGLLFTGVLLSTLGNTQAESGDGEIEPAALEASVRSTLTVMSANLCFAFRVLCQKRYRGAVTTATDQLDNTNLLYRMQTTGWMILLLPAILSHYNFVSGGLRAPMDHQTGYLGLSLLNSTAYVIYNLSSCYVLTQVSALQSMGINCLRRMLATMVTCLVFGVTLSTVGVFGIAMCFTGFALFTVHRNRRQTETQHSLKAKDSNI